MTANALNVTREPRPAGPIPRGETHMRRRFLVLPALAASVLLLPSANAALPPQITDPAGDVKGTPAYDIVSVQFDTLKTTTYKTVVVKKGTKKVTKKVAVVTPTDFVINMTLAGPPSVAPGTSYQVIAGETPCGPPVGETPLGCAALPGVN